MAGSGAAGDGAGAGAGSPGGREGCPREGFCDPRTYTTEDEQHIQDWCARCGRVGEPERVRWMPKGESLHEVHAPIRPGFYSAPPLEEQFCALNEGTTPAGQTLRRVADIVDGARNRTHGHKERSFTGIAKAWTRILGDRLSEPLKASDVAHLMVALKEQRIVYGDQSPAAVKEHAEDILGYWAIYLELIEAGC